MAKHFVSNKDESPDMFENRFLDAFSRVHWSIPLFLYVPLICYCLFLAMGTYQMKILPVMGWLVAGFAAWTFAEYVLHRFVFHYEPPGELGKRLHFIFHGVHHDYPMDSYRLVMPPPFSIPLAIFFFYVYTWSMGMGIGLTFYTGFVLGYLFYDMSHYAFHHANIKHPLFKKLKDHHMIHHFHDPDNGYGVSSIIWDHIFGTTFKLEKKDKVVSK